MEKELKDKLKNLWTKAEKHIPETLEPKNTIWSIKQILDEIKK